MSDNDNVYTWEELKESAANAKDIVGSTVRAINMGVANGSVAAELQEAIESIRSFDVELQAILDIAGKNSGVVKEDNMDMYVDMAENLLHIINVFPKLSNALV